MTPPTASTVHGDERHPWAIRLGRLFGIPIDVHVTFLVLLGWIAFASLADGATIEKAVGSAAFTALVFVTVVLHELGHALAARRFGCQTRRILLLPIGGIASLDKMPTRPVEELVVAVAGPLVNVVIAAGIAAFLFFYDHTLGFTGAVMSDASVLTRLLWVNVALAMFNLLPAFPMDGGRVLRAILAMFLGRPRATRVAALVGRALALALGIFGLVFQPMLALVALFVWSAARVEASMEETRAVLEGVRVARVMTTHFDTLPGETPFAHVADRILADRPHEIVIVENDRVVGLLTRRDVLWALAQGRLEVPLHDLVEGEVATARPDELLVDVLPRLEESGHQTLVVTDGAAVLGVVHAESIGELLFLDRARARPARRGGARPTSRAA